jgi:hypothetical protein
VSWPYVAAGLSACSNSNGRTPHATTKFAIKMRQEQQLQGLVENTDFYFKITPRCLRSSGVKLPGQRIILDSMSEDDPLPAQDLDTASSMMDRLKTKTSSNTSKTIEMRSLESSSPTSAPSTSRASTSTRNSIVEAPVTKEEIEKKPWKYIGYKGYAEFIASDNDFYILRRFASLNSRVALTLQDQISVLEEQLDDLDKHCSRRDAEDLHNGSFRDDREERTALVEMIYEKLTKYSAFAPFLP